MVVRTSMIYFGRPGSSQLPAKTKRWLDVDSYSQGHLDLNRSNTMHIVSYISSLVTQFYYPCLQVSGWVWIYKLQLHTVLLKCNFTHVHMYWLVRMHEQICIQLRVMEHSRVSLTAHACYMKGCTQAYAARVDTYVGMYTYATGVSPMCSKQSLKRIVSQGAYSSDIISGYSE